MATMSWSPKAGRPGRQLMGTLFFAGRDDVFESTYVRTRYNYQLNFRFSHQGKYGGISFEILSGNFAGRFSRKDATPSLTSAEDPREKIPRLSTLCASIG